MIIIAEKPNDRVLVDLSYDELANILGEYSKYSDGIHKKVDTLIESGIEIDVTPIYKNHELIHALLNQPKYSKARTQLAEMLKAITPMESLIETLAIHTPKPKEIK